MEGFICYPKIIIICRMIISFLLMRCIMERCSIIMAILFVCHQSIQNIIKFQNNLYFQLMTSLIDCGKCEVYTSDVAVKFESADEKYQFEPDVMVVCDDNFDKSVYVGVPKLVIEVLSKTTKSRDLGIKLDIYEKYGVDQYWIVDINKQEIKVYSDNVNGRFKKIFSYSIDDPLIWNNNTINLTEIFQ